VTASHLGLPDGFTNLPHPPC